MSVFKEKKFKGLAVSKGVSYARICLFNEKRHENLPIYKIDGKVVEKEQSRFYHAISLVKNQLNELIESVKNKIGEAESEIFVAQKMILEDSSLHKKVENNIKDNNINAEASIAQVFDFLESKISAIDDEYIKERSSDFGELKRRILDVLANINPSLQCSGDKHCRRGKNRIIVAQELTPRLTMEVDTEQTLGFVTEKGGIASHAAILARALNIPAVSGIPDIHSQIMCGTRVLIDGDSGVVFINPSKETKAKYPDIKEGELKVIDVVEPISRFKVLANISSSNDIKDVLKFKAEGIGLYRTEFEFFSAGRILTEEEQLKRYQTVLSQLGNLPVYFRLLDIGGDKKTSFLNIPQEENPYLGFRGARFLLGNLDLFKAQARALARSSLQREIHIMYPMIVEKQQFEELHNKFNEFTKDIEGKQIKHGVMFEVPSACMQAEDLLKIADFGSIGTNDLVQYFFAVDRNNEKVAYDYNPDREVFWQIIKMISDAAKKQSKSLSICGEIANTPKYVEKLLKLGINNFSMSAKNISYLRNNFKD